MEFPTFLKEKSKQESKHIIWLDINTLYGFAISNFLATGGFRWTDPKTFHSSEYSKNNLKSCVLKVDL